MWKWLGSLFTGGLSQLIGTAGKVVTDIHADTTTRQSAENQRGVELATGYIQSVDSTNKLKAEHQTERQLIMAFLLFVLPVGVHWWAVMLDQMPFFIPYLMTIPHKVGSWRIAAPPGEWGVTYHEIIRSFFIAAPTLAGVSMLARAFRR